MRELKLASWNVVDKFNVNWTPHSIYVKKDVKLLLDQYPI